MRRLLFAVLALFSAALPAEEGMWPLDGLPLDALKADYDFTPAPGWRDKLQGASLRLSGGCSAAFVSARGLVLTNHHCVSRCLAQLSGRGRNLLQDGFIARSAEDEAICPELELHQLLEVTDITKQLATAASDLSAEDAARARQAALAELQAQCSGTGAASHCDVVPLHGGSQTRLYRYRRFRELRLVFAPETAIARFGGTTDSFSFPRYVLDMSLLRVYEDGRPHAPDQYFAPRAEGPGAGELVFVTGHPGSTQRNLTVAQLETLRDVILPQRLAYLAELRGVLSQYVRQGGTAGEVGQRELLSVENTLKAFRGRHAALSEPGFIDRQREQEQALQRRVRKDSQLGASTAGAWDAIAESQLVWREIYTEYSMLELMRGFQSDLLSIARHLVRAAEQLDRPDAERLPEYTEAALPQLTQRLFSAAPTDRELDALTLGWSLGMLRELLGPDHPAVQVSLGSRQPAALAAALIDGTRLDDPAQRKALWEGGSDAIAASTDPLIRFVRVIDPAARAIRERYEREILRVVQQQQAMIDRARHALQDGTAYPDASYTLRLSYGQVRGWKEASRVISPFTTLAGAAERATDHAPFALPDAWQQAADELDLATPMNFTTTHDIVGGNSGSPVLDAQGRLVGLVFDGNLHSLGGAYAYDARYNRAIAVHPAIMRTALQTVYAAPGLAEELFGDTP